MLTTWIETGLRGRQNGPARAGMWSSVVIGTHPIQLEQRVWLEVCNDDEELGTFPGFWLDNRGVNSLWHVPLPPLPTHSRVRYRAAAQQGVGPIAYSPHQESVIRPNLPGRNESPAYADHGPEGLVGNRNMTARVDARGATYDIFYPTVGLHTGVRPAAGDEHQSRVHFRAIMGGLAVGSRIDWFCEHNSWQVFQRYEGATNLLVTELSSRKQPIRVVITDLVAMGPDLPRTPAGDLAVGQYIRRFRIYNDGDTPLSQILFGIFVHSEVNGGVGEPVLSWVDGDRILLASNGGQPHTNPKLARAVTVAFAVALDHGGTVTCEAPASRQAMLLRPVDVPAGGFTTVDLLVAGGFFGWPNDQTIVDHWLRPALAWFRTAEVDRIERETAEAWDRFLEPIPELHFPSATYSATLRRSTLASAMYADGEWGAVASGYNLGLDAYCWPRDAVLVSGALDRLGHTQIGRKAFEWLSQAGSENKLYRYWFQKYTIDRTPEWETPAVDQSALVAWGLERFYRRTGDKDFLAQMWPTLERSALVCMGDSGHPGLRWLPDLKLLISAGPWEGRYGAFLFSNACAAAGLRSAARLARELKEDDSAKQWESFASQIWDVGVMSPTKAHQPGPGLIEEATGRFLECRRPSRRRGFWSEQGTDSTGRSHALCITMLAPAVPLGLIAASDPIMRATASAILERNQIPTGAGLLARWMPARNGNHGAAMPPDGHERTPSCLATLWMARYLIQLGRETGEASAWHKAVELLDAVINQLGPLGLALRSTGGSRNDRTEVTCQLPGVWDLHTNLIETILDLAGLDHDVAKGRVYLDPILPESWPHVGMTQSFTIGRIKYQLERAVVRAGYRLTVEAQLQQAVRLDVGVTCPGMMSLSGWKARPNTPASPGLDADHGRLSWTVTLPRGNSSWEWNWNA